MLKKFLKQISFTSQQDFADNYEVLVPENFNFAYDVVDAWALEEPNKKAMLWTDDEGKRFDFTFADFKKLFCLYPKGYGGGGLSGRLQQVYGVYPDIDSDRQTRRYGLRDLFLPLRLGGSCLRHDLYSGSGKAADHGGNL